MLRAVSGIAQVKPDRSDSRAATLSGVMYLKNKSFLMKESNNLNNGYLVEIKAPCILARIKGSTAAEEES